MLKIISSLDGWKSVPTVKFFEAKCDGCNRPAWIPVSSVSKNPKWHCDNYGCKNDSGLAPYYDELTPFTATGRRKEVVSFIRTISRKKHGHRHS